MGHLRTETTSADGGWSGWSTWDSCSVTCGYGLKKRHRLCNNPRPSAMGLPCDGTSEDVALCNGGACSNGGWSGWSTWDSCSVTCGYGLKKRHRLCNNPRPSAMGLPCDGTSEDVALCNGGACSISAFLADRPSGIINNKLAFSTVVYRQGTDFVATTGTFTCSIPGTYLFSVTLVKKRASARVDLVYCYLNKNSDHLAYARVDPTDDDTDKGSAAVTSTAVVHLNRLNTVYLTDCTDPSTYMEYWSSFTGVLIHSDM